MNLGSKRRKRGVVRGEAKRERDWAEGEGDEEATRRNLSIGRQAQLGEPKKELVQGSLFFTPIAVVMLRKIIPRAIHICEV